MDGTVNARHLSRNTAALLREVGLEGRSFAIEHCRRVIGFLIPLEGRAPVKRGRKVVYEVPEPEPLLELTESQAYIVRVLHEEGESVPDRLLPSDGSLGDLFVALAELETTKPPLVAKSWMGYQLTPAGARHAERLGP